MEIGSFYEINPKCVERDTDSGELLNLDEVNKYKKTEVAFTSSGRSAIALALRSLERECPHIEKKCLMPGYMCDSVFLPFIQNGWQLCFYHIDKNMKADAEELCGIIEKENPGMLFIHTYFGTDTWKELRCMIEKYQNDGIVVMEDVTQSYYLHTDTQADYIVGSLRKWYAIPDGGFVATNQTLHPEYMEVDEFVARERFQMQRNKWQYLTERYAATGKECGDYPERLQKEKESFLSVNKEMEAYLDKEKKIPYLSGISKKILRNTTEKDCKTRRDENYRILFKGLQNKKTLKTVYNGCEETAAPLYMPVYMNERDSLQRYLREHDIYVPVLWPVGNENGTFISEEEKYIFSHIAAIPIDQRYGREEMNKIIGAIENYESAFEDCEGKK